MSKMLLPVALTESEKVAIAGDLCRQLTELEAAKAAKRAASAEHNDKIKKLEGAVHGIKESLASGTVEREVEVERRPIPFAGKVAIYRLDRDPPELWKEVPMDDDERQLRLGDSAVPGGKVTKMADHRTEEQDAAATPEEAEELRAARLAAEREERVATLARELAEKVTVVQLPTDEGSGPPDQFVGTLVHGDGETAVTYEQTRGTADEARAATARHAAEHITAMQEEKDAADRAATALTTEPDPIDAAIDALRARVVLEEKGDGKLMARIDGAIEGLPGRQGFSGPIRATAQETIDETLAQLRQMLADNRPWMDAIEASKQNEIAKLAAEQAADDASNKPKRLLKAPKGARAKKIKVTDADGNPLPTDDGVDTTPPPDAAF